MTNAKKRVGKGTPDGKAVDDSRKGALLSKDSIRLRLSASHPRPIGVTPILTSSQVQPASLDVRLGPNFRAIKIGKMTHLDPLSPSEQVGRQVKKYTDVYKILGKREAYVLHPGEFALGATLEHVRLPLDIAARFEGRSSWGRLGILVHATAGYVDPGFEGNITVELANVGKIPVSLYPGVRIGQLSFFEMSSPSQYDGKYQHSFGVVSSRIFRDPEYEKMRVSTAEYEDFVDRLADGDSVENHAVGELPASLITAIKRVLKRRITDVEEGTE